MKKQGTLWKAQALCCLCLVFLLPVAAAGKWCNNPDNFKWLRGELQDEIDKLDDNLLPSMVKYSIFKDVNTAGLTDPCFIVVTAEQLNNTLLLLMSHFRANSYTYNQTQRVVKVLTHLYRQCSDENSHRCVKPATKVVTACRSDLFAYFKAVLNHYEYIFDQCNSVKQTSKQSEGYCFFLEASNISVSSNCCLVDLHKGWHSSISSTDSSRPSSSRVSTPQPFCSLMSPVTTVMDVTSPMTNVVTEDNKSALVKSMSTDAPHTSDGNLIQSTASTSGTLPCVLSASGTATSPSQTVSEPNGVAGTVSSHKDDKHMNSQTYLYLFIGTLVMLVLVICALIHSSCKLRRLQQRYWSEVLRAHEPDERGQMLTDV
ncbi:uncharacterized protein LOC119978827 [Scyliorhinus canicula]|uniref:uncharacterized protein LOC119978827 n=1 Tax=Scyliorhinus canicula TaxID=7830 RepID=UPI0018F39A9A|nr:uncharacterized protein LOC119978827 [Scyliorhinus canicula]